MTASPDPADRPSDLAVLAHELKTPLAAIIGYADAMRQRAFGPLDEPYARSAETIHAAARHLLALVEDLAGASLAEPGPMDARSPVAEVLSLFALRAKAAGIALDSNLGEAPLTVNFDPLALRQILINLVANALAAAPRGGRVSVTLASEGANLRLTVEDTGPGFKGGEGTGLGLVRALTASHGGDFALDSPSGGGARASVRLPTGA